MFALVVVALTVVQYDFMIGSGWRPLEDPAGAWPSGLTLGTYGWAQSLNFAASGLLLVVFAAGLHRGLAGDSKVGPALLALSGVAMALLAFETDPIVRAGPRTLPGWVHDLAFVLFIVSLVPAFYFLWRRMRDDYLKKLRPVHFTHRSARYSALSIARPDVLPLFSPDTGLAGGPGAPALDRLRQTTGPVAEFRDGAES